MTQDDIQAFFSQLEPRLLETRAADRRRFAAFFETLSGRLAIARTAEKTLDRQLARRFNVFDFVDTSELGLSSLIAHLLDADPDSSHGQDTLFLQTLLRGLERDHWELEGGTIWAQTEHDAGGRRIDVVVEIAGHRGKNCLAIENKPYADDQPGQIADYLNYLDRQYQQGFLLVYLSPRGEAPSELSLPRQYLPQFASRFMILPYARSEMPDRDEFDHVRCRDYSLAEWFLECSRRCDVDRLRWFLRDGERFCRRQFGGETMSTHGEQQQVEEFLKSNPTHMRTAFMVADAWPGIQDKVLEDFGKALYHQIEKRAKRDDLPADIRLARTWEARNRELSLTRSAWRDRDGLRARITLSEHRPRRWFFGVGGATTADGEKLANDLMGALGHPPGRDTNWHWWKWTDHVDWSALVPQLFEELQQKEGDTIVGGEILAHHSDEFMDIVGKAVPILDQYELDGSRDQS